MWCCPGPSNASLRNMWSSQSLISYTVEPSARRCPNISGLPTGVGGGVTMGAARVSGVSRGGGMTGAVYPTMEPRVGTWFKLSCRRFTMCSGPDGLVVDPVPAGSSFVNTMAVVYENTESMSSSSPMFSTTGFAPMLPTNAESRPTPSMPSTMRDTSSRYTVSALAPMSNRSRASGCTACCHEGAIVEMPRCVPYSSMYCC